MRKRKLKAIDLYAGVGGWSLGLALAGVKVVKTYELWESAALTHEKNLRTTTEKVNIRNLKFKSLPRGIDIIVGSPPCIEFSYANRGGSGDIVDGLKDIAKFLRIVQRLKPKYWAMENVPRVKEILDEELKPGGILSEFRHLKVQSKIIDMSEFGLPQRRKRCIAGNFDIDLLMRYRARCGKRVLSDVIDALCAKRVADSIYGLRIVQGKLFDHEHEHPLSKEETRINREVKSHHPVYNHMRFPDSLEHPVRTITATCTRVSRESVVIRLPRARRGFRRLSLRERSTLQGFPITFQFFGGSYSQKLTMIGNAVPPLFSFYVTQAMRGVRPDRVRHPVECISRFHAPIQIPKRTPPHGNTKNLPWRRRFRFAIPSLRFKSGVGFEMANSFKGKQPKWQVRFVHGNSKDIKFLRPNATLLNRLFREKELRTIKPKMKAIVRRSKRIKRSVSEENLQIVWTHRERGTHPFTLLDKLGALAKSSAKLMSSLRYDVPKMLVPAILKIKSNGRNLKKIEKYSRRILVGILISGAFNSAASKKAKARKAKRRIQGR